ncbi:MAG: DUF1841 family protein [Gammaproteobacteria bacterium]|nr:DUF1841 family protein [Gammaproteobacteria bacterium]
MIFTQDRNELRAMYSNAWRKHGAREPLSPLEAQIAEVIEQHPEYEHAVSSGIERDYTVEGGETNPFLHMGLHLGIREQVATDRPAGIAAVFAKLAHDIGDAHTAEHRMIDCLAETLWDAERHNQAPDELQYLERLRRLTA